MVREVKKKQWALFWKYLFTKYLCCLYATQDVQEAACLIRCVNLYSWKMNLVCLSVGLCMFLSATKSHRIILKTRRRTIIECVFFCVYTNIYIFSRFPPPPKVIGLWNFDSRSTLDKLKTQRSLIFWMFTFTDFGVGFFRVVFPYTNHKIMCVFTISSDIKHHSYLKFWI